MEEFEFFPGEQEQEEEQAPEEKEGNRTFVTLVTVMGGLLAVAVCAFVAWAVFIAPRMAAPEQPQEDVISANLTPEGLVAADTTEVVPTHTKEPTGTPPPTVLVAAAATEPAATAAATATARPTATRQPSATATPLNLTSNEVPATGLGLPGTIALAVGLLVILVGVRWTRRSAY
jgi:hypothetical protein